jgi:hypothetical protein
VFLALQKAFNYTLGVILCPICNTEDVRKRGKRTFKVMFKSGLKDVPIQTYRCEPKGHFFKLESKPPYSDSFIEYVTYIYLECLSLNTTVRVIRATYEKDILSKLQVLKFIKWVADALPTLDDVDRIYDPVRSGYLALDGVWFPFRKEHIVLLVCFDPVTFDIVGATWREREDYEGYTALLRSVTKKLGKQRIKGVYGDGDNALISALKKYLPVTPFQLCVVHKSMRMQQTIPLKSAVRNKYLTKEARQELLTFTKLFQDTLYANSKEESLKNLTKLLHYTQKHPREKFQKAVNSLKRNFKYTLTHFDYPNMQRDNNLIECFNGTIKPRLRLMKSFKKKENLDRYLKLFLLEFRFRPLKESRFKHRRGKSPLELGEVNLPEHYNYLALLRKELKLLYHPKKDTN